MFPLFRTLKHVFPALPIWHYNFTAMVTALAISWLFPIYVLAFLLSIHHTVFYYVSLFCERFFFYPIISSTIAFPKILLANLTRKNSDIQTLIHTKRCLWRQLLGFCPRILLLKLTHLWRLFLLIDHPLHPCFHKKSCQQTSQRQIPIFEFQH